MTHQELNIMQPSYGSLLNDACLIIEEARHVAYRAINNTLTIRNWHLGERIAREELGGAQRAEYGKRVVAQLADDLTARYGKGFKSQDLYNYISFFRSFPEISDAVSRESGISDAVSRNLLPWTHYRELYVRMYDQLKRTEGDNPTVGLLLCSETSEDMARYSVLNGSEQIFQAKYLTYLPTKEELAREIENQKAIFALQQGEKE